MLKLSQDKAWIFRITHIENVRWAMQYGLCCCNHSVKDPNFRSIGNKDLIAKRTGREIPIPPGGTLSDYVPFYFTPHSPMLMNIKSGYNGVTKTPMPDIAIFVTTVHKLAAADIPFVFTDRHAFVNAAQFSSDIRDLGRIDWKIIAARDFRRDLDDPGKLERYMAETLAHKAVPLSALSGIACYGQPQADRLQQEAAQLGVEIKISACPTWYF